MTLTFDGAASAGAACSESGEGLVVNDKLSTSATSATTGLAGLTGLSAVATATTASTTSLVEVNLNGGLEAHKVGVLDGTHGVGVSVGDHVVDGGNSELVTVLILDLILDLLVLSGFLLGSENT